MVVYNRYIFGTSIPTMYIMYVHVYVCTITVGNYARVNNGFRENAFFYLNTRLLLNP